MFEDLYFTNLNEASPRDLNQGKVDNLFGKDIFRKVCWKVIMFGCITNEKVSNLYLIRYDAIQIRQDSTLSVISYHRYSRLFCINITIKFWQAIYIVKLAQHAYIESKSYPFQWHKWETISQKAAERTMVLPPITVANLLYVFKKCFAESFQ